MRSHARAMAIVISAFLLCGTLAAGCGSNATTTTTPTPPAQTGTGTADSPLTVFITNSVYAPNPLTVKVGQFVNFKNNDQTVHSATFDNGTYESGDIPALSAHDVPVQMTSTGTFTFHCRFHGEKGSIVVTQ
jgi:plastocyanin